MKLTRRAFGRRVVETAATLGAASIGPGLVGSLASCATPGDGTWARFGDATDSDALANNAWLTLAPGERRIAIIGSGYGGAVAALRLTEAGIPVTLFEMGRIWNRPGLNGDVFCSPFAPDGRAMWFRDSIEVVIKKAFGTLPFEVSVPRAAGIMDVRGPETMRASMGRGLGGGSLVNLAIYVHSPVDVLRRALPAVDPIEMYQTYYPRAISTLRAEQLAADLFLIEPHRYSRVGAEAAGLIGIQAELTTSGYSNAYLRAEVEGRVPTSVSRGEGGFGNNYGKLSLDKTYFAEALATGLLTIHSLTEIRRVSRAGNGEYRLHARQIDVDGDLLAERELPFSHVFVAAGSFGSSELLVRSRERGDLPDLNAAVGTEWGPNSDIFVARRNNALWRATGPTQNTVPGIQWRARDQHGSPFFSMVIPLPFGIETYVSTNICVTESPEAGHFVYDSGTDEVSLVWHQGQQDDAIARVKHFFDRINVRASSDYVPAWYDSDEDVGYQSTYHPCGGVPLSRATDDYGRVRNYDKLYVIDSSLFPVSIGGNPALTTAALAERNIERILAEDLGGPTPDSCVVQGCGPLRDPVCQPPYDYFAQSIREYHLYALWDRDDEDNLEARIRADVLPEVATRAREVTLFVKTARVWPTEARAGRGDAPSAWIITEALVDPNPILDRLNKSVDRSAGFLVDGANPATYERAWRDGARSPGAQLVSMFQRRTDRSRDAFREHWYTQDTRQRVAMHPTWNYWRFFVRRALTANAPSWDGVTILHTEEEASLESDSFYLDALFGRLRSDLLWLDLVDPVSLVSVPCYESRIKSGYMMG